MVHAVPKLNNAHSKIMDKFDVLILSRFEATLTEELKANG